MRYLVRPWTDHDAGADRDISRSNYPEYRRDPTHPAWFPATQLGAPRSWSSRYLVERDAANAVAYATLWEVRSGRFRFDLAVRPECQRQGVGTDLLRRVTSDALAHGATGLQARVRDDKCEALDFIGRRGFREVQRMAAYRLDFACVERSIVEDAFARLRQRGIRVTTLAAARENDAEYLQRFLELYSATREGWPDPDPAPSPIEIGTDELRNWLDDSRLPEAFFIAIHQDRYIAFTSFFGIGTAVHPEFRGQGIATLLKAGSIADALRRGLNGQTTSTASRGMQQVLERLGYRRLWSEVRLMRALPVLHHEPKSSVQS
jgi:GNAT superfamily N-acetyltransferase